jgi:serine/threonine protein phosphatase PrpC
MTEDIAVTTSHTDLQLQLEVGIGLDIGQARRNEPNQDSVGIYSDYCEDAAWLAAKGRLFVVADGMGGASGGKEASEMAVQIIIDRYYEDLDLEILPSLERAIQAANTRIKEYGQTALGLRGLGTTLVVMVIRGRDLVVANVGDSRAYLLRQGTLRQLSLDHTSVQEQVRDGLLTPEEAATHPRRHVLSRNLGSRLRVQPAIATETLVEGDTLLLCSDGLWGSIGHEQIGELLQHRRGQAAANALVELANTHGGPDNISAIVIQVNEPLATGSQDAARGPALISTKTETLAGPRAGAAKAAPPRAPTPSFEQSWRWASISAGAVLILLGLLALGNTISPLSGRIAASTASPNAVQTVGPRSTPQDAQLREATTLPSEAATHTPPPTLSPADDTTTTPTSTPEMTPTRTSLADLLRSPSFEVSHEVPTSFEPGLTATSDPPLRGR